MREREKREKCRKVERKEINHTIRESKKKNCFPVGEFRKIELI